MAINWELARTPDFVGIARQAQDRGRERGMQQARQSAYAQYSTNPDEAVNALMGVDPEAALRLRQVRQQDQQVQARKTAAQQYGAGDMAGASNTALAAGDLDLVKTFTDMTKEQRSEESRRAQLGVSIGLSLKNVPPQAREMRLKAMLPQLTAQGLTEADIAAIPLDDEGIEAGLGLAMSAADILGKLDRDRSFNADREDAKFSQNMEGQKFDWQRNTDTARMRNDNARLGLEGQRLAIARADSATNTAVAGVKLTEGQARDGFNAKRIQAANRVMSTLEGTDKFDPTMTVVAGGIGRGDARRYEQAKEEWADSIIRLTTGAAATKPEIESAKKAYFASPFDAPDVVEQKRQARERVEQDALFRAGPGALGGSSTPAPASNGRPPLTAFQK
jgi:hypothetical protein